MVRVRTAIGTLAVCALLGACSAAGAEPQGLTASPTTASTPTPTPTATPSPTATELTTHDLSDAKVGIVFVDTPHLTGAAASAHDAVAIYEREAWRSLTTGKVSPMVVLMTSSTIEDSLRDSVKTNAKRGHGLAGTFRVTVDGDVAIKGSKAVVHVCEDYSDVEFTYLDGSPSKTAAETGFTHQPVGKFTLDTTDDGVTWRVAKFESETAKC